MSLNKKQAEFSVCLAKLILFAEAQNTPVIVAEVFRSPEEAKRLHAAGKGIINSVHTKKLAADLFRLKNGTVSWDFNDYKPLGDYWKTLHPDARWGGDFIKLRDAVHFSFIHNGFV
jgi:hypothetical protein